MDVKLNDAVDLLTAEEQRLEFKVEMETLQAMVAEGEIPPTKIGDAINSAINARHQKQQTALMA